MVFTLRDLEARGPVRARQPVVDPRVPAWRRLSLLAVIVALVHHQLHLASGRATMGDVLAGTGAALLPVEVVFALWGPILVVLAGYARFALSEEQRRVAVFDRVSRHVAAIAALSSLLLLSLEVAAPWLAGALAVAVAAVAAAAYLQVYREIAAGRARPWIGVPFALLLGVLALIAIGAIDGVITALGCPSSAPAISLVIGTGVIAVQLGLRHRDVVLPALVAWGLTGICAANRPAIAVANAALLVGGLCAAVAVVIAATRLAGRPAPVPANRARRGAWPSPSPRSHRA